MAKRLMSIGDPLGIQFQLHWPERLPTRNPESATYGGLSLWIRENRIWGGENGAGNEAPLEWSWIELLEFLSNAWPYLCFESGYPLGLHPIWPAKLRDEAEARWQTVSQDRVDDEQEELFAFEETHDLSRGLHGLFVPNVWLVREGDLAIIGTRKTTIRRPFIQTINTLERLGDSIRERINILDDPRSREAVQGWNNRLDVDMWSLAEIATRWPANELKSAAESEDPRQAFELEGDEFRMTERLEIAGLTRGLLDTEQLRKVYKLLDSLGPVSTPVLDELSREAESVLLSEADDKPYNEGYSLANWLRQQPGVANPHGRVEIDSLILSLGVPVGEVDLATDLLDAVACWGQRHGPAIWINRNEKHLSVEAARRSTLAHELCHLLIDRDGALPLADVVNGNAPKWVEQRADAFAAELLLPRKLAVAQLIQDADVDEHVNRLANKFGVSRELTAWQIHNSGVALSPTAFAKLRSMVSRPENFLP